MSSEAITRNDLEAILNEIFNPLPLVDLYYPVGSYYETSDTTFNPNVSWGGTWVLENAGYVHVSGGTGYAVSGADSDSGRGTKDGGNKDAILVSHKHTFNGTALPGHSHGTGNSTQDRFACYRSTGDGILRRTIKNGTGTSYEGNVHTDNTWARLASTQSVSAGTPNGTITTEGSSATNANMQPYINVNRWHRTA